MCDLKQARHGRLYASLARNMKLYICRRMSEGNYNIRTKHLFVMLDVMHNPGASLKEIGQRLDIEKPAMTKTVKALLALGYVDSVEDKEDKRMLRLYLKDKAYDVLPSIKDILDEMRTILYDGFTKDEVEQVNSLVQRMNNNLIEKM